MLSIAWISQVTGRRERARAAPDELGSILAPDAAFWGYHALVSAELALDEGETATAHELLRRALAIAEKIGEPGLSLSPQKAQAVIRAAARRAMGKIGSIVPYRLEPPFRLRAQFSEERLAEARTTQPGGRRLDAVTVEMEEAEQPWLLL